MLNISKTIKNTTFILIVCILIISMFVIAPILEEQFTTRIFTVTFDTGVGDSFVVSVPNNTAVIKPEEPVREGYNFIGWYYMNEEYNFKNSVCKDIVLKAIWEKEKEIPEEKTHVVVKFDVVGGSLINDQLVLIDGTAKEPDKPTRDGYTFVEWQLDGKKYDFNTVLKEDITLIAVWKENL